MRVFSLTTGSDTAGIGYGIHRAFARHGGDIDVRTMVASSNYIGYPVHLPWAKLALQQEWDAADVVMIHNSLHAHDWYDVTGKPTVLMHHGLTDYFHSTVPRAKALGIVQIGSTINLPVLEPDIEWVGPPVDIAEMRRIRQEHYRPGPLVRVGHAPTNAAIKGTAAFLEAMERLARRHPVEQVLIQGKPHRECLALKATCDIFFDQPVLGYGVNAIESWAMGLPVIVGVADQSVRQRMVETWGELPFVETDDSEAGIGSAIERLVADQSYRSGMAAVGFGHVTRWHSQKVVVKRLSAVYRSAGRTTPGNGELRLTPHQAKKVSRLSAEAQLRA